MPPSSFAFPALADLDEADRLDAMLIAVDEADAAGVLAPMPLARNDVARAEEIPARLNTVRLRLYLLGYLRKNRSLARPNAALRRALRRFQEDAGLAVDGWVGPQTWTALQELVGFEPFTNLAAWLPGDGAHAPETLRPALLRAIRLRLHVQGLLPNRRVRKNENIHAALAAFTGIAAQIGLTETPLPAAFCRVTLQALFDQDALVQRLAFVDPTALTPQAEYHVARFMLAQAKVELWLYGYDVEPDGQTKSIVAKANGAMAFHLKDDEPALYRALQAHWRNMGLTAQQARRAADVLEQAPHRLVKNLTELFKNLLFAEQQATPVADSALVYEHIVMLPPADQQSVWARVKNLGSSIWDGARRVLRWFKALVHKGITKMTAWAKNLGRLAFRYASDAFAPVRRAVGWVAEAVRYLGPRTFPNSSPTTIFIRRDADFDLSLYIHPDADPAAVGALMRTFRTQAARFRLGVRYLRLLVEAGLDMLKRAAISGWLGLVLVLVRLYRRLPSLRAAAQRLRTAMGSAWLGEVS